MKIIYDSGSRIKCPFCGHEDWKPQIKGVYIICKKCVREFQYSFDDSLKEVEKMRFLVSEYCSYMRLNDNVAKKAIEIIKQIEERGFINKWQNPKGTIAGAIYIAAILSNEHRRQRDIADIIGVTEVTIRNRYKALAEAIDIEELK